MECADEIGAIIHCEVRSDVERGVDVFVVSIIIFALYRVDGDLVMRYERSSHIVLSREGIRCSQDYVCATILQCPHQVGSLRCYVQTGSNPGPFQRLLFRETGLNLP